MATVVMCAECGVNPKNRHRNAKYCPECRKRLLRQPKGSLTPSQEVHVISLFNQYTKDEIAQRVGCSKSTLTRWMRINGFSSNSQKYSDEIVAQVVSAYEEYGKNKTAELYPDVNVRSIVERHEHKERQMRWTDDQIVEAARMGGLVSHGAQAHYFDRPGAYNGSIKSLWAKVFRSAASDVNGLAGHIAWQIIVPGVPATMVKHSQGKTNAFCVLWIDLVNGLKPGLPSWVQQAVQTLAKFQTWLHGTNNPEDIRQMIINREMKYEYNKKFSKGC